MSLSLWFRSPRYLLTLFLAIMLVLAASLSWLGWRLLKQDRALESQRVQERLDNAADLVAASLLHKFSEKGGQFTGLLSPVDLCLGVRSRSFAFSPPKPLVPIPVRPCSTTPSCPPRRSRRRACLKPVKLQSSNRRILPKPLQFFVNCPNVRTRQSVLERSFASVAIFAKHNSPERP